MEFGLFVQAHVPRHEMEADPENAEHSRLMRELELAIACDRFNWKYVWSVEHHFLEEYSHISASEIFLPYVAARTQRLHVGSAIYNITPPVNHPARIAERVTPERVQELAARINPLKPVEPEIGPGVLGREVLAGPAPDRARRSGPQRQIRGSGSTGPHASRSA